MIEISKRKWGWYLTLWNVGRLKVKLLWFKAGKSCSYQRHSLRNEVWCILKGAGKMLTSSYNYRTNVDKKVTVGDVLEVPSRIWHQYTADENTLVLEIQSGKECIESDIERK